GADCKVLAVTRYAIFPESPWSRVAQISPFVPAMRACRCAHLRARSRPARRSRPCRVPADGSHCRTRPQFGNILGLFRGPFTTLVQRRSNLSLAATLRDALDSQNWVWPCDRQRLRPTEAGMIA